MPSVQQSASPSDTQELKMNSGSPIARLWHFLRRWFLASTFTPTWLPRQLRHPAIGYLAALLLEIAAIITTVEILQLFPAYAFASLLPVLAIVLVALTWGAGPSFVATLVGAMLVNFALLPPAFTFKLDTFPEAAEIGLFLIVGWAISIGASQVERARRQSERLAHTLATERARLETILDTVPDGVSIHDARGTIIQLNQAALQNVGMQRGGETVEAAQQAYQVRAPTGALLPLEQFPVMRALHGETTTNTEIIFADAEGHDRQALLSAAPLLNARGRIDGVVVITHDITALRESEHAQQSRANELVATFEAMADAVFVFDQQGGVSQINATARQLFGLDPDVDYSQPQAERGYMTAVLDEDGQPLPEEAWPFVRVLRGETLTSANPMDIRVRLLDGRELELSVSGAPVVSHNGSVTGAICVCRDVTERRKLERRTHDALNALLLMAETLVSAPTSRKISGELVSDEGSATSQRLAELASRVLNCQRVSITALDNDSRLVPIAAFGFPPEFEQSWWMQTSQLHLSDYLDAAHLSQLQKGEAIVIDARRSAFASLLKPSSTASILYAPMNKADELLGFISIYYGDTTHEYSDEEFTLAKATAKLTSLVIERERLLREREEAHASELALREANRRMEEFLSIASHELRTPLTTIKGNAQLATRQLRNALDGFEKLLRLFDGTERQTRRLNRLVDDLLDVSRMQADRLELRLAPCDLVTLVREIIEEQRVIWPLRTISLDSGDVSAAPIYADADRIRQVITNYLNNALKYSPEERPVQVRLRLEGEHVQVSVQDQGPGLSPEEQEHIWERFYRVPGVEVQSGSGVGLGLGLHINKTIIEQHHGQVGVESTEEEGSTFWFSLPLAHNMA